MAIDGNLETDHNDDGGILTMRMKTSEHDIQTALFQWFEICGIDGCKEAFAIPNGGKRHVVTASKLKREGVKAGIPDIFIPVPISGFSGLFIELKTSKGKLTATQREYLDKLHQRGYKAVVAYGLEDAIYQVKVYFNIN